jgi:hypothetical protein
MAPLAFPRRLQNERGLARIVISYSMRSRGNQVFLKGALVIHWLPCAVLRALAVRADKRREEEGR